ncbi:MAG: hypothetical protein COB23_04245 [Methylophaga sp.]|nr:MAG: hypothetical protein COB23_04245 [Methylophaga sp.]
MMVTLISECEKKALKRTRRVLDAFANRIGSNTWQTVITEEGLAAVKKLLRKTASKNTAVSCFWIRTRSRSELVWVVGNRSKFNAEGVVPVNTTQVVEIKMDENKMMNEKVYANTNKQPLEQHLFAVGYLASQLMRKITKSDDTKHLEKVAFVAGCLHDIGKLDPEFQKWLNSLLNKNKQVDEECDGLHIDKGKFSFETHASHNEISLLMYHLMDDSNYLLAGNKRNKAFVKHTIYWHHAKRFRKEELKNLEYIFKKLQKSLANIKFNDFYDASIFLIQSVNYISNEYGVDFQVDGLLKKLDKEKIEDLSEPQLPKYKKYSEINDDIEDFGKEVISNAKNNLVRTAVISADRLVSKLSAQQLQQHIEEQTLISLLDAALIHDRGLSTQIKFCLKGFEKKHPKSERNQQQSNTAKKLAESDDESHVKVLNGPAGCGKTKIALEWALNTQAKKIIWICPRVQVCQGLFNDLTSQEYLPNAQIEINTGELKYINHEDNETPEGKAFSGDIVLTTIDQVINAITTHRNVTNLVEFMNAHIVFDEFHEYINMPAFNLLFAELIQVKKWQGEKTNTLLVSATPNYYFIDEFLGIDDIVDMPSFNQSKYQIEFKVFDETLMDETNPLYQQRVDLDLKDKVTFVISNTAIAAQRSFIQHQQYENSLLFHSKFKKSDKVSLFNKVLNTFKKGGNREFTLLRSGPVVQASLNISCDHMISEFTHAENWLQRLGRLDRFGQNNEVNTYVIAIPESIQAGKGNGACARFLGRLFSFQSAKAWYEFLQDHQVTNKMLTITEIYQLYRDFYKTSKGQEAVEADFITVLKKSAQLIDAKVHDPMSPPKKKSEKTKIKMKKSSLRGDSRFVNMAVCDLTNPSTPIILDEYIVKNGDESGLTESLETIRNTGLIDYVAQKDSRINENTLIKGIPAKQMNKRKILLEGAATSPEYAIYLSYTESDLNKIGEDKPHDEALYYAICVKQAIGTISLNQFINN